MRVTSAQKAHAQHGATSRLTAVAVTLITLVAAAGVAGCGSESDGDPQLTVYLSAPLSGPRAAAGRDVAAAAELALEDAGGVAGDTAVDLQILDDATEQGWDGARSGADARRATQDSTAIAYIGELDSGASRTSIPITNEAGLLQVSPGSGAEDLTREDIGSSSIPSVQPSGTRTFGRVIPSDRAQGEAAAVWMSQAGIASVEVIENGAGSSFADALVAGLRSAGSGPAIVEAGQDPDAGYLAVEDDPNVSVGAQLPGGLPVYASDGELDDPAGPKVASERREATRVTSAAMDTAQLPPAAAQFLAAFSDANGHRPGRYAAYGYEAMAVVLDSIERAEDPLDRSAVIDAFLATNNRDSILGTYSIDGVGDTTLPQLGAYETDQRGRPIATRRPITLP
ncbi:MAG: ABC transporter substrate-binding protein [Solirubrobacterales bacterium]|nr:ABC transporter substrate-binding protein [Solirubrobacterales bacterium]